jgi:hypothetical protein
MNAHQQEAMDKDYDILAEHIDAFIIVAVTESDTDDKSNSYAGSYKGGTATAIGLCEVQKARLFKQHLDSIDGE